MVRKELVKDEKTIKLLKKEDFLEGNIHGNNITSAYSPTSSYEVNEKAGYSLYYPFKHNLNPIPGSGVVDLILTGSFVNSMFLENKNNGIYTFGNTDWKKEKLQKQYGKDIFGLNQNAFNKYQKEILLQRLIKEIKQNYKIS